jgi:tight adherence protein B
MAAELRAGQPPPAALAAAADAASVPVVAATVVSAARGGGPVADLLDTAAGLPGAAGLHGVAACWRVAEQSGTGLAQGLERVVRGLRDEQQLAREVAGQLAAPRATGRLLAMLPAFGWLLGSGLGAAPLEVLLTSPLGWACLALGVPLQVAGWWWMERLARSVEPWRT